MQYNDPMYVPVDIESAVKGIEISATLVLYGVIVLILVFGVLGA